MEKLKEYHHFRNDFSSTFDRTAKYERYVVDSLLASKLSESEMESSICWELKHQASTIQFARILALKRGLEIDICAVGLLLHDIASIKYGKYNDHAQRGTTLAKEILSRIGGFSSEEEEKILKIIQNHSNKHIWTDDPYQEIGKDVDVLDCFLYKGAFDFYLGYKSLPAFQGYLDRAKKIWSELGLPIDIRFSILDGYSNEWFQNLKRMPIEIMEQILAVLLELSEYKEIDICPLPFCIMTDGVIADFYANRKHWNEYIDNFAINKDISINKGEAIRLILMQTIKDNVADQISTELKFDKGIVMRNYLLRAKNILKEVNTGKRGILFWPLVDIYQTLEGEKLNIKLKEIGVI